MIGIPLLILALAAGVHLLIKVNREYLGGLFKFLAWLVILLSLLGIGFSVARGIHHIRVRHHFKQMGMRDGFGGGERRIIMKEFGDRQSPMDSEHVMSCCGMAAGSSCCKMAGDSIVMDKAMCEKMMGKEACEKLCKERGQCIMSKDESVKMCSGDGKPACCMEKGK